MDALLAAFFIIPATVAAVAILVVFVFGEGNGE